MSTNDHLTTGNDSPHFVALEEKVDSAHAALIVIDYQNDFVAEDGAFARTGSTIEPCRAIAPALREVLAGARKAGIRGDRDNGHSASARSGAA